jgi:glycosyltransferase involved in cell wall biosynthesis
LAALGAVQIAQFAILTARFDAVLFSNAGTQRAWAQRIPLLADRFHTIRICSNIPYHPSVDAAAELTAAGYSVPRPTILFFGTGHQSVLFDYVEAAFLAVLRVEPNAALVIVGMGPEKLRQLYPSLADLGARVHALGYVAAPHVSLWLQVAELVLAPLVEGVSARKGTVMAALQHGQAVVTTRGIHTLDDITWDEICLLAALDREAFATKAVEAFQGPERRATVGRAARAEYDAHASASVTAARILACANQYSAVESGRGPLR